MRYVVCTLALTVIIQSSFYPRRAILSNSPAGRPGYAMYQQPLGYLSHDLDHEVSLHTPGIIYI